MKTGRELGSLATELVRQAQSKKDYTADTRLLSARHTEDGSIFLDGIGDGLPLRPTAHEQMSEVTGIPKRYYDRLMSNAPDLLCKNINHWLHAEPKSRMIRCLDGGVRAILSDKFRRLDNYDLFEAVYPKLRELEAEIISGEITDRRMYLKAVTPRVQGVVNKIGTGGHNTYGKVDDVIQAGVVIGNSEIGQGGLSIEEMTYRLVCLNGAIHAQIVRKTHVGGRMGNGDGVLDLNSELYKDATKAAADRAFFLQVRDVVAGTISQERLDRHLRAMESAAGIKPEADPVAVVEAVQEHFGLGDFERGSILKHLVEGGDLTAFGIANAVTRASQDVHDYELATVMESAGGKVFEMSASEWRSLLAA